MKAGYKNKEKIAGEVRVLNVRPDTPDIRDRYYQPALVQLRSQVENIGGKVLNQGTEGACTGFALAAVVNLLNMKRGQSFKASPRMFYEMAQKHDEWPGESYEGSSCRGAIRGWNNMGVCSDDEWTFVQKKPGNLSVARAQSARKNPLGAYYRLRPDVVDYHAALNEVDAVYVSARVHEGWFEPKAGRNRRLAVIQPHQNYIGGHAFAIVGYNDLGFIVQNSWGKSWGTSGFAIWTYADWKASISDGWVFRLGISTPTIFGVTPKSKLASEEAEFFKRGPNRHEIAGHFAHFDDGKYKSHHKYWTSEADIRLTADRLKENSDHYKHLLIFAHGGLNSPKASATRIEALKDGFMRNGVYPFHLMYDTGLAEEIRDVLLRGHTRSEALAEGFLDWVHEKVAERSDVLLEDTVRKPVTALWEEMKRDARLPFEKDKKNSDVPDGLKTIMILAEALQGTGTKIHIAGHSTGGVLIGHLLNSLDSLKKPPALASCSLFAPACTMDFFDRHYAPRLVNAYKGVQLPALDIYNLSDKLELDDNVVMAYQKSLLFLVSNALERKRGRPILGINAHLKRIPRKGGLSINVSKASSRVSRSTSHGGFDNDKYTMNSLLKRILGTDPQKPFQDSEMKGY